MITDAWKITCDRCGLAVYCDDPSGPEDWDLDNESDAATCPKCAAVPARN